jgi:hypothetical protein
MVASTSRLRTATRQARSIHGVVGVLHSGFVLATGSAFIIGIGSQSCFVSYGRGVVVFLFARREQEAGAHKRYGADSKNVFHKKIKDEETR